MTIRFLLLTTAALVFVSPAFSQESGGALGSMTRNETATAVPSYGGGGALGSEYSPQLGTQAYGGAADNGVLMPQDIIMPAPSFDPTKPVSEMSPQERAAYWMQLPDKDKQAILERRAENAKKEAERDKWKHLTPGSDDATKQPANPSALLGGGGGAVAGSIGGQRPTAPRGAYGQSDSVQPASRSGRGAEGQRAIGAWSSMSVDEKKAFVAKHRGEIRGFPGGGRHAPQ